MLLQSQHRHALGGGMELRLQRDRISCHLPLTFSMHKVLGLFLLGKVSAAGEEVYTSTRPIQYPSSCEVLLEPKGAAFLSQG